MVKEDKTLPQLYRKTATGSIQVWKIWVEERKDDSVWIMTEYGKENSVAIQQVRQKRKGAIENQLQENFVLNFRIE